MTEEVDATTKRCDHKRVYLLLDTATGEITALCSICEERFKDLAGVETISYRGVDHKRGE